MTGLMGDSNCLRSRRFKSATPVVGDSRNSADFHRAQLDHIILCLSLSRKASRKKQTLCFKRIFFICECTQRAFGAKMTSYQRRCDVITSHRRY